MKVLVATRQTQGVRANDFCFAEEGELVIPGSECDGEPVDGECGCRRSVIGLVTRQATTTFRVVERADLTPAAVEALVLRSQGAGDWLNTIGGGDEAIDHARHLVVEMRGVAEQWPVDTVLERRGDEVLVRRSGGGGQSDEHFGSKRLGGPT